jgi:hypothetical protein
VNRVEGPLVSPVQDSHEAADGKVCFRPRRTGGEGQGASLGRSVKSGELNPHQNGGQGEEGLDDEAGSEGAVSLSTRPALQSTAKPKNLNLLRNGAHGRASHLIGRRHQTPRKKARGRA